MSGKKHPCREGMNAKLQPERRHVSTKDPHTSGGKQVHSSPAILNIQAHSTIARQPHLRTYMCLASKVLHKAPFLACMCELNVCEPPLPLPGLSRDIDVPCPHQQKESKRHPLPGLLCFGFQVAPSWGPSQGRGRGLKQGPTTLAWLHGPFP